jgi:hypothetical protein
LYSSHYTSLRLEVGAFRGGAGTGAGAGLIQLPALTVDTENDDQWLVASEAASSIKGLSLGVSPSQAS